MDAEYPGIQSTPEPEGYLINMGTGPFIPLSADPFEMMKSRKNPNYWLTGAPFVDGMDNHVISDADIKFTSLVTGKVNQAGHGSIGLTRDQVQQVQDQHSDVIELQMVRYNQQQHFLMNHLQPPFDDWNVRHAVQLALDREDWLEHWTVGEVSMGHPYLILHPDSGWGIPIDEFRTFPGMNPATKDADIAEANRLLDEAFGAGNRPRTNQYVIQLLSRREVSLWGLDFFREQLNWEFDVQYVDTYGSVQFDCLYTIRAEATPTYGQTYIAHAIDGFWKIHSQWRIGESCRVDPGWTGKGPIPAEEWAKTGLHNRRAGSDAEQKSRRSDSAGTGAVPVGVRSPRAAGHHERGVAQPQGGEGSPVLQPGHLHATEAPRQNLAGRVADQRRA